MILVDSVPVLSLPKEDPRRDWYETEVAKIKKKRDFVIKKTSAYRLNKNGVRVKPPYISIQSDMPLISDRGMENWGLCETYKKRQDGSLALDPHFYRLQSFHTLNPRTEFDKIFYFMNIVDLHKYGFSVDNPEEEAIKLNENEIAELDVRYAIFKSMQDIDELRFIAKAWGIAGADTITVELLRRMLFDAVKKSEENKQTTQKGYKEFMNEVMNTDKEVTEARGVVSIALSKSILACNKTTRRTTYVPTGDVICIVPLDNKDRLNDYIADHLLRKNKELLETLRQDISGEVEEFKLSVADVDQIVDRQVLRKAAAKYGITVPPQMKTEAIRTKLIEKIQSE